MSFWQKLFGGKTDEQSEGVKNNQSEMKVENSSVNVTADQPMPNEPQIEPEQVVLPVMDTESPVGQEVAAVDEKIVDDEK